MLMVGQAKKRGEIGLFGGGSYYIGELNKVPFVGILPAGGAFYRHTFDTRFAVKGMATIGMIGAEDEKINGDQVSFNQIFYDVCLSGEFNFFQFLPASKKYYFTPYAHAGIGFLYYKGVQSVSGKNVPYINIPFGVGAKFNINETWTCGVEYSIKKTFNDNLDYGYAIPTETMPIKQEGYQGTKDWVHVFGVSVTHKIKYRAKCPAFD